MRNKPYNVGRVVCTANVITPVDSLLIISPHTGVSDISDVRHTKKLTTEPEVLVSANLREKVSQFLLSANQKTKSRGGESGLRVKFKNVEESFLFFSPPQKNDNCKLIYLKW